MPDRPLLLVTWLDSQQPADWTWLKPGLRHVVPTILSVGWVVHEDAEVLVLAPTFAEPDEDGDVQALGMFRIPVRAVIGRKEIVDA